MNKEYTSKELHDMRGVIFEKRLHELCNRVESDDSLDEVYLVTEMVGMGIELMETPDEEIIKEYNKLLN